MARRPNYGFEKRQKELERQKKKEAKAERKELRRREAADGDEGGITAGGDGSLDPEGVASDSGPDGD
jgi:hypothetical protein